MLHVLMNFIDLRVIYRDDMYKNSELKIKAEKEEDVDASKEFLNALEAVVKLCTATEATQKRKKRKAVRQNLDRLWKRVITSTDIKFDDVLVLAEGFCHMGLMYTENNNVEERADGEDCFVKCLKLLRGRYCERKTVLIVMTALDELKMIWSHLHGPKACYEVLMKSMEVYLEYTQDKNDYPQPIDVSVMLGMEHKDHAVKALTLENLYIETLDDLVIRFRSNPEDMHKLVEYTHKILNECLFIELVQSSVFELPIQNVYYYNNWVLTLVDLCRFFLYHKRFAEARDHLMVAQLLLKFFHVNEITQNSQKLAELSREWINNMYGFMRAHVATSQGSYATEILHTAKENMLKNKGCYTSVSTKKTDDSRTLLLFSGLEQLVERIENKPVLVSEFISNLDDVKDVFAESVRCYTTALEFFNEKRSVEIFSQLEIDLSKAYKYMSALEKSTHQRYKLQNYILNLLSNAGLRLCDTNIKPKLLNQRKAVIQELIIAYGTILDITTDDAECYIYEDQTKNLDEIVNNSINVLSSYRRSMKLI